MKTIMVTVPSFLGRALTLVLAGGAVLSMGGLTRGGEVPSGWFLAGSNPDQYETGTTSDEQWSGKACAYLKAKSVSPEGFATLMQMFAATDHRGKRLRLSGHVKAESVDDWAGLWMRVDGPKNEVLSFDNMHERPIQGTRDWERIDIVLDVPQESEQIAFGILLHGKGKVYLDELGFEDVDQSVPVTDTSAMRPRQPANLGFEK